MSEKPLLELRGVSKHFGAVQALSEVDFQVRADEVMALVGDNGAGKSTLIKGIAGIYTLDEGEIYLRSLGICRQVRVRHHGTLARLEVDPRFVARFMETETRTLITDFFKDLGFQFVALDLDGYVMGSLNRELSPKEGRRYG